MAKYTRLQLKALYDAGNALSNCAYNLSQCAQLEPRTRQTLKEVYETWDKARSEVPYPSDRRKVRR